MARKGKCAICGELGKLTEDHVPPQSVVPASPVLVRRLADALDPHAEKQSPRPGQAAAVFPTLCAKCNSERLGKSYDPALARFANAFGAWVRAAHQHCLSLPDVAIVEIQPALVARAVIGHLLAAEPKYDRFSEVEGSLPESMRRYFLSQDLALPGDFRLYVWPHASSQVVIGRGIGHWDTRGGDPIVADTLKFFPVAFAVVSVEPSMPTIAATQIKPELATVFVGSIQLEIPLRLSPGATWPERPQQASLVLVNRDRVMTVDRSQQRAT